MLGSVCEHPIRLFPASFQLYLNIFFFPLGRAKEITIYQVMNKFGSYVNQSSGDAPKIYASITWYQSFGFIGNLEGTMNIAS